MFQPPSTQKSSSQICPHFPPYLCSFHRNSPKKTKFHLFVFGKHQKYKSLKNTGITVFSGFLHFPKSTFPQKYYVMGQSHLSSKGQNTLTSAFPASSPFLTLYAPPFPSPFPLRPLTPSRFPIWESSWIHRGNHRGSIVVPDAVPITVPSPIPCCGSLFPNPLQWAGAPGITVF